LPSAYILLLFLLFTAPPPKPTPFPYTTLFRSGGWYPNTSLVTGAANSQQSTAYRFRTGSQLRAGNTYRSGTHFMAGSGDQTRDRSEEHTSELQSRENLVCRLLLEKKKMQSQIA